jgi:hypothetical protein
MNLIALPAFSDSYIWMLHDGLCAVVVDPGQDAPVHAALDRLSRRFVGILVTPRRADHVGRSHRPRSRLKAKAYGRNRPRRRNAEQMHDSLGELAAAPRSTPVCCAHDYTLTNHEFTPVAEPRNQALPPHLIWRRQRHVDSMPALLSSSVIEHHVNTFPRRDASEVVASARMHGAVSGTRGSDVFAALRQWKNEFR